VVTVVFSVVSLLFTISFVPTEVATGVWSEADAVATFFSFGDWDAVVWRSIGTTFTLGIRSFFFSRLTMSGVRSDGSAP